MIAGVRWLSQVKRVYLFGLLYCLNESQIPIEYMVFSTDVIGILASWGWLREKIIFQQ